MIINKRVAIALLGGLAVAGLAGASASTLGTLTDSTVGSADQIVASCDDNGITVSYETDYDAVAQYYEVTAVTLSSVELGCGGLTTDVTLRDDNGDEFGRGNGLAEGDGEFTIILDDAVRAELVEGVSVVISG